MSKIEITDRCIPLATEAPASSKVLLELAQDHVIFYVAEPTKELRAQVYGEGTPQVLMQGVQHCHGFIHEGVGYLYTALVSGGIRLLVYRTPGEFAQPPTAIAMSYTASYVHVVHQHGCYFMTLDTGLKLFLLVSKDPYFTNIQAQSIYANSRDLVYRMSKPVAMVHPDNYHAGPAPSLATIAVERLTKSTGATDVGFFVVEVVL